jgi:hypothetical protein
MRTLTALAIALLLAIPTTAKAQTKQKVDVVLVLAADVSKSIDEEKFRLQREGYATAIESLSFVRVATNGAYGRIAVIFVEWSYAHEQKIVVPWTIIDCHEAAKLFAARLRLEPRPFKNNTGIGAAIRFSTMLVESSPFVGDRHVIDISGDGTNSHGEAPAALRDEAVKRGITINGLVILSKEPSPWPDHTNPQPGGLKKYYEDQVIGGIGAFVVVASGFETFAEAVRRKLILEVAGLTPRALQYAMAE